MDISGLDDVTVAEIADAVDAAPAAPGQVDGETGPQRVSRIERQASVEFGESVSHADVLFLIGILRRAGDQRVQGLREAAGLIRAAKNREVTTRFLVGKKEQAARGINSKLMDTIANLIDKYADDARDGRL